MSEHHITVRVDEEYLTFLADLRTVTNEDRETAYVAVLECSDPAACPGWIECRESHEGFDPEEEDSPAYDMYEDVEIHGVLHDWRWGYGWTLEYAGCPLIMAEPDVPDDIPMDRTGKYLVDAEWDDTDCHLTRIAAAHIKEQP